MAKISRLLGLMCWCFIFISTSFCFADDQVHNDSSKLRVGIVGSGGSGMTTAWLLEKDYDVTLFERQERLGGHANTVQVTIDGQTYGIDAGFEFFSDIMYPYFNNLLKILNVPLNSFPLVYTFYNTDGSDALILPPFKNGQLAWESFTPSHLFEMEQFKHFVDEGSTVVDQIDTSLSFEQFVEGLTLTHGFKNAFLYPFFAAAWGINIQDVKTFAAYNILKYIVKNKPQGLGSIYWKEVVGGTSVYIQAVADQLTQTKIKLSTSINRITYADGIYTIIEQDGTTSHFDHLILATNALEARDLLKDIPEKLDIRSLLGQMEYFYTTIAIHGDSRFMPKEKSDWSVVNIRTDGIQSATTVYKPWLATIPIFKSWITYDVRPDATTSSKALPDPLYALIHYYHPHSNVKYFQVQHALESVQGNNNLWFAGNYTYDNDSHESAIQSAIRLGQYLAPSADRLKQLTTLK